MKPTPLIKLVLTVFTLSLLEFSALRASAQAELVEKLDIVAVKSIKLLHTGGQYMAQVRVVFSNASTREVKLTEGDFAITFKGSEGEISIGRGKVMDLLLPAAKYGKSSKTEYVIDVLIGREEDRVVDRIIGIFNIVANPTRSLKMGLKGECNLGVATTRGWVYTKSVAADFGFTPKIQKEVLFQ